MATSTKKKKSKQTSAELVKSPVRPRSDNLIIVPDQVITKSKGGIIIPDQVSKKMPPSKGVVVAVGPGRWANGERVPMEIKVGDHVMFTVMGVHKFADENNQEYFLVREPDVIGVIEGTINNDISSPHV